MRIIEHFAGRGWMWVGLSFLILPGCKKFVQVQVPSTELVTASVFTNSGTATAAQLAIYTKMYSNSDSWLMSQDCGLLGDELTNYSTTSSEQQIYINSLQAINGPGPWNNMYNYIYQANAILENLNNNNNISPTIKQQLIGESEVVRAYVFFYLVNLYGDIPLVTTTNYVTNESISRTPTVQVYQQIIKDLESAQSNLNANYVDASDTTISSERTRPNKATAQALLARVYLYLKQYDSAETYASLVINNNLYSLCKNLSGVGGVFLKNSTEAIWQLATPLPASFNTPDGESFILKVAPGTGISNSTSISTQLLNAFEPKDQRFAQWIGVYSVSPTVKYYYPYKYQSYSSSTVTEYVMMLRLAEQYLIRAEARVMQGNTSGAISDLNVIRGRAGLNAYSGQTDQNSIDSAIMHERQVELFTEWGHRWFDMIRTGTATDIMGGTNGVCSSKGGTWGSTDELLPIPQNEITNDPNLAQNQGY